MKGPKDDSIRDMGEGYSLLAVGITFALVLVGAALGGVWLDRRLGTMPLCTIVGTFAGMALGGYWVYVRIRGEELGRRHGD